MPKLKISYMEHGQYLKLFGIHIHKAQTFWNMFVHNFITIHKKKPARISTSIQNMYLHYQPCNIEPLIVDFLVVLVRVCGLHPWPCEPSVP